MEGGGPMGALGNPHADVLNTFPEEEEAKKSLLEEVRRRAKGAFQAKDMRSCDLLYSKALELCTTDATLYSNRAMVYLNLSKVDEALADAKAAIKLDGSMIKAYYRKAQALQRLAKFDEALAAIAAGRAVKADASFDTLEKQVLVDKEKDEKQKAEIRREAQDTANAAAPQAPVSVATMVNRQKEKKAEADKKAAAAGYPAATPTPGSDAEDLSMRGYKTRANGAKTSYFHMDISDEAKALLAENAGHKKLDGPVDEAADPKGKSAWNTAGTWESKNLRKWVEEQLDMWIGFSVDIKAPDGTPGSVSVSKIENLEGPAEIVMARGKRKKVLDLSFTIHWTLVVADHKATGKLIFQDVSTDDEPELRCEVDGSSVPEARPLADMYAKSSGSGLQPALMAKLQAFLADFTAL
jgi:tetratricopeptide (TPR) repeat protein